MNVVKTKYGMIHGVTEFQSYKDGHVKELSVNEKNVIATPFGDFIPSYASIELGDDRMKKQGSPIKFYPSGSVKAIALESQTLVETPIGKMGAELVTFYESGALKRIFPLNAQINGFWSEEDEKTLASTYTIALGFGILEAKLIGIHFYESGAIRSLTLWPHEVVEIETPIGVMAIRSGISLYESGALQSIEPDDGMYIGAPIGFFMPYDPEALGVHGDTNSFEFTEEGAVKGLKTVRNAVEVTGPADYKAVYEPILVESHTEEGEMALMPLALQFDEKGVTFDGGKYYDFIDYKFRVYETEKSIGGCSGSCGSCSGCGH